MARGAKKVILAQPRISGPVAYKTVNLKPATYERLKMYQIGGKSLSEVIEDLMDQVEPESIHQRELKIARRRLKEMRTRGVGLTLDELEKKLESESE